MNNVTAPPCDRMDFLDFSPFSVYEGWTMNSFADFAEPHFFEKKR